MPGPETSDRERLLRLIDGGPEAVREMQAERAAEAPPAAPAPEPRPAGPAPAAAFGRPKIALSEAQKVRLAQAGLAAIVLIVAVQALAGAVKAKPAEAPAAASSVDSLRLVGVDWAERPVALLEDRVTGRTYFVKKTESVLGARVTDIQKDRVTVVLRGRAVELR